MPDDPSEEPRILARSEHRLSRKNLHEDALKVLYRLHRSGFAGYLCGGAVRDLLLGRTPKDYDIATDARPQQVRRLFRNSRIIGRRFRLVHVFFRDGNIEVATFRRDPDPQAQAGAPGELLITDDNVFGTPREDAFRRDFTVNALFYNIADFSVIDYVGGVDDLEHRLIRAIGDPEIRFQEDPIRMTRACELAGRLGFSIEAKTQSGIWTQRGELAKASTARLTEEVLQLLRCGHAGRALQWMLDLGLLDGLMPEIYAMVDAGDRGLGEFGAILPILDEMVARGRQLSEIGLLSILLLPTVLLERLDEERRRGAPVDRQTLRSLAEEAIAPFFARFTLSKLKAEQVIHTLMAFVRLGETGWQPAERMRFAQKPWFDDALLLFEVLAEATGEGREELAAWQQVAESRPRRRGKERAGARRRPRRRRRRRRR